MLTHRNFMANLAQVRRAIPFGERDRLVIVLPLHHAFPFTVTMAVAPAVGGEVTFENDLRRIRDRMAEVKPTLFLGVPALFEVMYRNILSGIEAQGKKETFEKALRLVEGIKHRTGVNLGRIAFRELHKKLGGSLRFMVSGGAALNPQTARDFANLGVCIIQGWGLSEAAPVLSAQRWQPRKFYTTNYYEERFGSIGQALPGVELALIDVPEKELYVHLHGEGEIIARGANITPGYWRSEEATAEIKLGEWLRTGDIGRIDDEGNVWITGRSKFVIVLESGEKIYPDEVEEKLELSPVVQDIVVLGRKLRGKTTVIAVVYPDRDAVLERLDGAPVTEDAVRAIVEQGIREQESDVASFKRVTDVILTDEPLPRTPIRKVMRGHIRETYDFDASRWARSWEELQDASATASADAEIDEDAAIPA
jgi:long-chain acyl-CoA synthetase